MGRCREFLPTVKIDETEEQEEEREQEAESKSDFVI